MPDDPDHFLRWARQQDPKVGGGTFVPRPTYGKYLASILEEADAAAGSAVRLTRVPRGAAGVRVAEGGVAIELEGGARSAQTWRCWRSATRAGEPAGLRHGVLQELAIRERPVGDRARWMSSPTGRCCCWEPG